MEEYQDNSLRGRVFRKLREDILSGVYEDQEEPVSYTHLTLPTSYGV